MLYYSKECTDCGAVYTPTGWNSKYCEQCSLVHKSSRSSRLGLTEKKTCAQCDTEYIRTTGGGTGGYKYCAQCSSAPQYISARPAHVCEQCGIAMNGKRCKPCASSATPDCKTCGQTDPKKFATGRKSKCRRCCNKRYAKPASGSPRTCKRCDKQYLYLHGDASTGGSKYCLECKTSPCRICGGPTATTGIPSRQSVCFTCLHPNKIKSTPRRRPWLTGKDAATRTRLKTKWAKQRALCYWCGKAPFEEIDHVVATTRGGSDSEGNLVPSCKQCNAMKGNRFVIELRAHRWLG